MNLPATHSLTAENLYIQIRDLILSARKSAARDINVLQVHTNFKIGKHIVEYEQQGKARAVYGGEMLESLSKRLSDDFGSGFSRSNISSMRRFYLAYQNRDRIVQTLSGQSSTAKPSFLLSWSHYVFLISITNPDERRFYEIESTEQNWTIRELRRQFDSGLYERLALSRDKDGIQKLAKEGQVVTKPEDVLKDPLVLEFLGLDEKARYSESDLESAIIGRIERFLLELGKGFLFESRQKRFTFDAEHFFVDLVFYNRLLRYHPL
ncbi:MAG: PDDEXK nuclease domain-containing protein [Rectinemataceae bacterium]|nr:PDDEXK nuclease domain-containing protein [Rectinemataceae bacterium]